MDGNNVEDATTVAANKQLVAAETEQPAAGIAQISRCNETSRRCGAWREPGTGPIGAWKPGWSARIDSGSDRQRPREEAVWLCELFENGVMMAVGHFDYLSRKAVRGPGRAEFARLAFQLR